MDFIRRAKFDAWDKLRGTSADDAMKQYIELAAELTP
jgi:diazepam-binding inhibitor (GABA receptor modulating acyl-CoA-binding protein)